MGPLGENLDFFSPLEFDVETNSDHKTQKNQALLRESWSFKTLSEWDKSDIWSSNGNDFKILSTDFWNVL